MQPLKLEQIKVPESHWKFDEPYRYIAGWMKARCLTELGDPNYRERYRRKDGEIRFSGLGMDKIERAMRTLTIKKLTEEGLLRVQDYEQKNMLRFLVFEEIKRISDCDIRGDGPNNELRMKILFDFCEQNRPEPRKYDGVSVPAYFLLDNEFDGMVYHHKWDWNCWRKPLDLPQNNVPRRTVSRQLVGSFE